MTSTPPEAPEPCGLEWKCHTPNLLSEILNNSGAQTLIIPLQILGHLLHDVATRAAQINDPELNLLMMRLTLYEIADPSLTSARKINAAYAMQRTRLRKSA